MSVDLKKAIVDAQKQYFKDSNNGPAKANVDAKYEEAKNLAEENIALGDKCLDLLTRHIKRLDEQIILATKNVEEQGLSVFDTMMEERASSSAAAGASVAGGSGNGPPGRKKKSSSSGGGGNTKGFNMGMLSGMDTDGLEDSYDEDGIFYIFGLYLNVSFNALVSLCRYRYVGGEPVYCVCQQVIYYSFTLKQLYIIY